MNERGAPVSASGFRKMLSTVGAVCGLPHVHPDMLRHSCGFYMADRREDVRVMQDWLGHANVQNTCATPPWRRAGLIMLERQAEQISAEL